MENVRFEINERLGDTIGEVAYRRIRSHIVNGQLLPDHKLKLDRMREVYGASVTTLREILNRLAVEELVTAEGQRGFRVAQSFMNWRPCGYCLKHTLCGRPSRRVT